MIAGLRTKNSRSKFPPSSTCFLGLSTNPYSLKVFWGKYLDFNLLGWWIFCWATLQLYIWWLVQTCKKKAHIPLQKYFFLSIYTVHFVHLLSYMYAYNPSLQLPNFLHLSQRWGTLPSYILPTPPPCLHPWYHFHFLKFHSLISGPGGINPIKAFSILSLYAAMRRPCKMRLAFAALQYFSSLIRLSKLKLAKIENGKRVAFAFWEWKFLMSICENMKCFMSMGHMWKPCAQC